ncbi:MAG: polysaccharide deacetylase family protein [Lachnospiraceae bacterium]|nr:polysaccharide deacetylase family protein [Lachnospiraceae bacterium]
MKKHLLPIILVFAMMLSFTACAVRKSIDNHLPTPTEKESEEQPVSGVREGTDTVYASETGKETEPATEKETEKVTEQVTEKVTEKVTEPETEPVTEPPAPETLPYADEWEKYDNSDPNIVNGWGPGNVGACWAGDEDLPYGRPSAARWAQNKYGSLWGDYIFSESTDKVITLTLDCGEPTANTGKILDTLKEKGVHATFFLTMPFILAEPQSVQRMIDEGHTIGNHTVNHKMMPTLSIEEQTNEIMGVHNYVKEHFGYEMHLMRFPQGAHSERCLALMKSLGYRSVQWTFAYGDYNIYNQPDPEWALNHILSNVCPGSIFLLHNGSDTNAAILGDVIDGVRAAGYTFSDGYPK